MEGPRVNNSSILKLTIYCTDRGQHPPLQVCRVEMNSAADSHGAGKWAVVTPEGRRNVAQMADPDHEQRSTGSMGRAPAVGAQDGSRSWESFTFDCPRCKRHTLIRADRMEKVITGLSAAGQSRVDLSHLERG